LRNSTIASISIFALLAAVSCGTARAGDDDGPRSRPPGPAGEDDESRERLESLRGLGYLAWDPGADSKLSGVVRNVPGKSSPGFNLYASGLGEVNLMDLDGHRVHTWKLPEGKRRCEHAELLRDGSLAVICTMSSLMLLDPESKVLLDVEQPVHHDVAELPTGSMLVAVRKPEAYQYREVVFDSILAVTRGGEVVDEWSTFRHLDELRAHLPPSPLDTPPPIRQRHIGQGGDYFHLNTIEVLPDTELGRKDARFRAGNLLICLRNVDLIAVLDGKDRSVLWSWGPGEIQKPHMPTLLDNGHILLFDNGTERGYSRIVELDPVDKKVVWEYEGTPPQTFFSKDRGSSQRLPNGDTLICESQRGHAFEVTPRGETVWEFWNPDFLGGARRRIYRLTRLPEGQIKALLEPAPPAGPKPPAGLK